MPATCWRFIVDHCRTRGVFPARDILSHEAACGEIPRVPIVNVYGHTEQQQRLRGWRKASGFPASLLITGAPGIGKQRLALWAGQLLLCMNSDAPCMRCDQCRFSASFTHPDLHWYFPRPRPRDANPPPDKVDLDFAEVVAERASNAMLYEPASGSDGIFVATVRAIVRAASLRPALGRHKVFVIGDAERMVPQAGSEDAANAFLKILEEPPPDTTFILTSSEPGALLPTVRSRTVLLRLAPLDANEMRQFLADPLVLEKASHAVRELAKDPNAMEAFVRSGTPGRLFAAAGRHDAFELARAFMAACESGRTSEAVRAAMGFGVAGSRGSFSDVLDALSELVHTRAREAAASGEGERAAHAAAAALALEDLKELAFGNASPQLLAMRISESLTRAVA